MKQYKDITSRENSIYKLVRALSQKKVRENSGLFLIEGTRLVEEANSGGMKIKYIIIKIGEILGSNLYPWQIV